MHPMSILARAYREDGFEKSVDATNELDEQGETK
jgi:hypothetical protein